MITFKLYRALYVMILVLVMFWLKYGEHTRENKVRVLIVLLAPLASYFMYELSMKMLDGLDITSLNLFIK